MRALTLDDLRRICPLSPPATLSAFVERLNSDLGEFAVDSQKRMAAFLAQYAHETLGFTRLEENLRYTTVEALRAAFKTRWNLLDVDDAWGYLNQPERLANRVYASRNGNMDEASGDGWKYRGRGLCHLTGRGNYAKAGHALNLPLLQEPDLLLQPGPAVRVGGWYWRHAKCNEYADAGEIEAMTRAINGGLNGIKERIELYGRALGVLA